MSRARGTAVPLSAAQRAQHTLGKQLREQALHQRKSSTSGPSARGVIPAVTQTHQVKVDLPVRREQSQIRQRKQQGDDQLTTSQLGGQHFAHINAMALVGKLTASHAQPRCSACSGRRAVLASSGGRVLGGPRHRAAALPGYRACRLRVRSAHAAAVEQEGAVAAEPVERPLPTEDSVPEAREAGAVRIPLRACPCRGVPFALACMPCCKTPGRRSVLRGCNWASLVLLVLTSGVARCAASQPGGAEQVSTSEPAREEGAHADVAGDSGKRDDSKRLDYIRTRYKARKQDAKERLGAPTSEEGWKNDGRLRRTRPMGSKERCTDPFFQLGDRVTARIIWSNAKGARAELVQDKRLVGCGCAWRSKAALACFGQPASAAQVAVQTAVTCASAGERWCCSWPAFLWGTESTRGAATALQRLGRSGRRYMPVREMPYVARRSMDTPGSGGHWDAGPCMPVGLTREYEARPACGPAARC